MATAIIEFICLVIFILHWWMMLYAKQDLGNQNSDRSFDPLYSRYTSVAAFLSLVVIQCLAMARVILYRQGRWPPLPSQSNVIYNFIIQATDWGGLTPQLPLALGGAVIFILGFALRLWAIRILGRLFTFEIGIRENHQIIETGPYGVIRHPSYSGYLLMLIGLGMAFGSLGIFSVLFFGTCVFFVLRINSEEKMLVKFFGTSYRQYQRRTKRLIPFLF